MTIAGVADDCGGRLGYRVVRLAAVADLHMRPAVRGRFRPALRRLPREADVLLLGGDLTDGGTLTEGEILCAEVADLRVPVVAVLGNHDHDAGHGDRIAAMLRSAGVFVLDRDTLVLEVNQTRLGIAGVMGGGGGFPSVDAFATAAADPEWLAQGHRDARWLRSALRGLDCDVRVALMHFAPVTDTLVGEPLSIYPGLGTHLLGEAVDAGDADFVVHGHAHYGTEHGFTRGGRPVRNVAHPVIRRPYAVYELAGPGS